MVSCIADVIPSLVGLVSAFVTVFFVDPGTVPVCSSGCSSLPLVVTSSSSRPHCRAFGAAQPAQSLPPMLSVRYVACVVVSRHGPIFEIK